MHNRVGLLQKCLIDFLQGFQIAMNQTNQLQMNQTLQKYKGLNYESHDALQITFL